MKTFFTAVSLTEEQAQDLIATIYSVHYMKDFSRTCPDPTRQQQLTTDLLLLLTLPIGTQVHVSKFRRAKTTEPMSFTTIQFQHQSRMVDITVMGYETSTPIDIASFFLNAKDTWDFSFDIRLKWKLTSYKPATVDPAAKEIAQAKWGYYA